MCASRISTNVIKYTRGLTRRSKRIKKIREPKIKKKYTYKKRAKYCPLIRQKKKNKEQEENLNFNFFKLWFETFLHFLRISTSCISRLVSFLFRHFQDFWRIPKDLANPSFSTIKNRGLANTYILANPSSGELLRSRLRHIKTEK